MNKAIIIGRFTKDPELRYAAGTGTAVTNFTLAVNRPGKDKGTDFISCVAFGKTAETIAQYLTKGRMFAVVGSIRTGSYEAQDGTKRYKTEVYVDTFTFIDSGKGHAESSATTADNGFGDSSFSNEYSNNDLVPVDDGDIPF